jgi:segregation and condensation protein A
LEYKKFKDAAVTLREKESSQANSFSRDFRSDWDENDADYLKEVSVFQLLTLFRKILKDSGQGHLYEVTLEDVSVTEKMNEIMEMMETTPKVLFQDLFKGIRNRMEIIGTFLALLELIKQQLIRAYQQDNAIWVQKTDEDAPSTYALVEDSAYEETLRIVKAEEGPVQDENAENNATDKKEETTGGEEPHETGKE